MDFLGLLIPILVSQTFLLVSNMLYYIKNLFKLPLTPEQAIKRANKVSAKSARDKHRKEMDIVDNEIKNAADSGLRRTREFHFISETVLNHYLCMGFKTERAHMLDDGKTYTHIVLTW